MRTKLLTTKEIIRKFEEFVPKTPLTLKLNFASACFDLSKLCGSDVSFEAINDTLAYLKTVYQEYATDLIEDKITEDYNKTLNLDA